MCGRSVGWLDIAETTIYWHCIPHSFPPPPPSHVTNILWGSMGAWNCFLCFAVVARPSPTFTPLATSFEHIQCALLGQLLATLYPILHPPVDRFCRLHLFAVNCMEIVRAIEKVEQAKRQSGIVPACLFRESPQISFSTQSMTCVRWPVLQLWMNKCNYGL